MKKKLLAMLSLLLVFGLVTAACGGDDSDDTSKTGGTTGSTTGGAGSDVDDTALSGTITGSGSSFTDAFIQAAIDSFSDGSDLSVTYNPTGSGQGKKDFGANLVSFAGTDSLVKDGDGPAAGSFLYVPTVAAPITISYNLSGVDDLQLSAGSLAGIFSGTIDKWDDAEIKADNPDADLPSKGIVMVHRADGSGTTSNFTKYLTKAAGAAWTLGSGDTVAWPANSQAGQKNTGVAQIIKDTDGAVGYVDLSDAEATQLTFAKVKNQAGRYVDPTIEGARAALEGATVNADLSYDPLDSAGEAAYPITSPTYLLVRTRYADQKTADNVKGFITFLLTDGQKLAGDVSYTKLSTDLQAKALAQLDKITVG
jgi:phosphate transport system substrate-binding protein